MDVDYLSEGQGLNNSHNEDIDFTELNDFDDNTYDPDDDYEEPTFN